MNEGGSRFTSNGEPIRALLGGMEDAGHSREPRVSVEPKRLLALVNDVDRPVSSGGGKEQDPIGFIESKRGAIFGRGYAAEPDFGEGACTEQAIAEADALLLTVPTSFVPTTLHVIEMILKHVAPALGWLAGCSGGDRGDRSLAPAQQAAQGADLFLEVISSACAWMCANRPANPLL